MTEPSRSNLNPYYRHRISIIIPAFNEAENLPTLFSRLKHVLKKIPVGYEIIVVDDGSTDASYNVIYNETLKDEHIKAIFLSRNFGHQAAINAGLDVVTSDIAVFMDADLQHPPEMIQVMYEKFLHGNEIILCKRRESKDGMDIAERTSKLFYKVFNNIGSIKLEPGVADFGMISGRVVNVIRNLPEHDRFVRGLIQWIGFNKIFVEYNLQKRHSGIRKYTFRKKSNSR